MVATDAADADSSPAELVDSDETTAEGEQPPKKVPWFQKRIDEQTAKLWEERRRADALNDRLMALLETQRQPEAPTNTYKPVLESYESYEDYTEALTDWKVDQKLGQVEQRRQAETSAQTAAREQADFNDRMQSAAAKWPEVLELVNDTTLPVSVAMADVIRSHPQGPDYLSALGANRGEAARIAKLSSTVAAIEMERLLAKTAEKPRKPLPPAPIQPLGGGGSAAPTDPNKFKNADEYEAWRRADLKARGIR